MASSSTSTGGTTSAVALSGRWHNRLGSVMELTVEDGDLVSGTFSTGVGTTHPEGSYHLTGYVLGDVLAFCVDFRPHGSVAAWAGHHVRDGRGERLVTLWHLAQPVAAPRDETDLWRGVLAGADEFERDA